MRAQYTVHHNHMYICKYCECTYMVCTVLCYNTININGSFKCLQMKNGGGFFAGSNFPFFVSIKFSQVSIKFSQVSIKFSQGRTCIYMYM